MANYFIDWLAVSQEFKEYPPCVGTKFFYCENLETEEIESVSQPLLTHKGSFESSIKIKITDKRITVSGNPSRINRLDNFHGLTTIDQCMSVYNALLRHYGLPVFTKATETYFSERDDSLIGTNGAVIQRIDITTNTSVGKGNELDYLRALSTQKIGQSIGHLYRNGCTVDWRTILNNARLAYRKAYNKAHEIAIHLLRKYKRRYGEQSYEYQYIKQLHDYCHAMGIIRFEQSIKSELLQRLGLKYWGVEGFDESKLSILQDEFLKVDERLEVTAMDFETITQTLINKGIVNNTRAANTTALYALEWMHGKIFDLSKSQTKTHRARLRKIGIDIALPYDNSIQPVRVVNPREVVVQKSIELPTWYQKPNAFAMSQEFKNQLKKVA